MTSDQKIFLLSHCILNLCQFNYMIIVTYRLSRGNLQESLNVARSEEFGWMKSEIRKHLIDILIYKGDEQAIKVCINYVSNDI